MSPGSAPGNRGEVKARSRFAGPFAVSRRRRVSVAFPEDILTGMDDLTHETNQHRSQIILEACSLYIEEKRRANLREKMKAGYREMAEINRLLAEELAGDFDCVPASAGDEDQPWRKA